MRSDVSAPADHTLQLRGDVQVLLWPTATLSEVVLGTATGEVDVTGYAQSVSHGATSASFRLRHQAQLSGSARPAYGWPARILAEGEVLFTGIVFGVRRTEGRGMRVLEVTCRTVDATPYWRDVRRVTGLWGTGAQLMQIAREDVADAMGLAPAEFELPNTGVVVVHDQAQLADLPAWQMFTTLLEPSLQEPFINALGVLKAISRSVTRDPDLVVEDEHLMSEERSDDDAPPLTELTVRYMAPTMRRVVHEKRLLKTLNVTHGYFAQEQRIPVKWSDDGKLRATLDEFKVVHGLNGGFLPPLTGVGTEAFNVTSAYGGELIVTNTFYDEAILLASFVALLVALQIPEPVVSVGVGATVGATQPWYKAVAVSGAQAAAFAAISRIGYGVYEIWGSPYDDVWPVDSVTAYDQDAPAWLSRGEELQNDFIPSQAVAIAVAVNELLYRHRAARRSTATIVDDFRIEPGDILGFPDGSRFYVTGYERQLTRGTPPELRVEGFYL